MKLNVKKVILVIAIIFLIAIGIWAGISLTQDKSNENENENVQQEAESSINNITNNNALFEDASTIDNNNTTVSNSIEVENSNIVNNNTTVSSTNTTNEKKENLNSYLEKFSLICYLDSRTKDLEKNLKRNEDYIDIAMLIAKECNALTQTEDGKTVASKKVINSIISEVRGRTITEPLETANVLYSYNTSTEQYYPNHTDNRIAHIFEITENTTENGIIKVKYSCCFPNETQLKNNDFSGLGRYVITMELRENSLYQYSKYRIQNYEFVVE